MNRVGELTKDEFEKIILKDHTIEDIAGVELYSNTGDLKRRCLMTPMTSPAPYYMAPYDIIIGSGSYPEVNGVDTKIGKAFAKVAVAYIPLPEQSTGSLTGVSYRIINDPKETYLFPNIFKGQVHTPHYEKTIENDDFDAYFTAYFNLNSHIEKTFTDSTNFSWRAATLIPKDQKNYAYCLENGNKTPLQGNSTMVLVRAQYIPDEWLNADKTPGEEANDGTFWRIRNTATGAYFAGYYNEKPPVFGTQEAVEYPEGITYYPIWLETDGKYMVKRNHYYKIAITEVLSAGAPDLQSVMDPAQPLGNSAGDNSIETRSAGSANNLPEIARCIRWEQNY
ncbi:MAG: hypothetical protein LIP04_15445 [Tannerellaceae bacterium]|nr:hypothetical protein [Tannerellaceae bacterium]